MKKKVIISVTTDLYSDQRVHKTCLSLVSMGYDVHVIGRSLRSNKFYDSSVIFQKPYSVKRFNLFFKKGFLFYMTFNIRLFFFLLFNKFDIIFSNDLDTLLPNFLISRIKKKPLVYDSHELFTEIPELIDRPLVKSFWEFIEKIIFPRLDHIITVSDHIASFYYEKYNKQINVIRNAPFKLNHYSHTLSQNMVSFKNILHKSSGRKIIYQGSLNKDRGIELMIESMRYIHATLFIVGDGDIKIKLERLVKKKSLERKVKFIGRVSFSELKKITVNMDLGLSFEEDVCLAYKYSLPNKIFDYIHSDIPVLVSDLPEMRSLVSHYKIGEVLKSRSLENVAFQINDMLSKKEFFANSLINAKKELCWENEEKKLYNLFEGL